MYFKLEKGSEAFDKLEDVFSKMAKCDKMAMELVESMGFSIFGKSNRGVAGGISCIQSTNKPDGFKQVGRSWQDLYYPKCTKENKELLAKMGALPIVTHKEFNDSIGFEEQFTSMKHCRNFGANRIGDMYLIEITDGCKYEPVDGMTEITYTEFKNIIAI